MTQRTRHIIANVLVGLTILCLVAFVVQHYMAPPRASWHRDLPWLAIVFILASDIVRSRRRRHEMHNAD